MTRLRGSILVSAAAAVLAGSVAAGCGGDDAPPERDVNAVLACIQDAGLKSVATAGDEPLGITAAIQVSVPPDNRITVDFFDDAERAQTYSDGQGEFLSGSTGGSSEVVDETVVVASAGPGAEPQVAAVEGCVQG